MPGNKPGFATCKQMSCPLYYCSGSVYLFCDIKDKQLNNNKKHQLRYMVQHIESKVRDLHIVGTGLMLSINCDSRCSARSDHWVLIQD